MLLMALCGMIIPMLAFAQISGTATTQDAQNAAPVQDQKAPPPSHDQNKPQPGSQNQQVPPNELPNAPSSSQTEPSLGDLEFSSR